MDDLSQPENNAHLSGIDADMTDSESEVSVKEEEIIDEDPLETPYILCEEEEFGCVSFQKNSIISVFYRNIFRLVNK